MQLFADEPEVRSRLESLGLSLEGLTRVVASGAGGWNSTTKFHPSFAPGSYLYFETTAAFRRLGVPTGWGADEADGQPRTFNADLGVAVVVQTGDDYTGIDGDREPTTRHPKGPATSRKVEVNGQLALPGFGSQELPDVALLHTWVLLVAVVEREIRSELSRPEGMDGGRPCGWAERILLPALPMGGDDLPMGDRRPVDGGTSIEFDVTWQR